MATEPIVGIDLGTSYTSVAAMQGGRVSLLADDDGAVQSPSVIAFPTRDTIVVGAAARDRLASDPARTIASPKRLLGRPSGDHEVQTFLGQGPWKSGTAPDGTATIEIWGQPYTFTQLCGYLIDEARKRAEKRLGQPVRRAAISVPVSFDDDRIRALRRAAQLAGIELSGVVVEPTAAALANMLMPGFGGLIAIYDFGGGTFDCSIVDVSREQFKVLATAGDTWLGGDDIDLVLAAAAANQFWRQHKVDLRRQAVEWQRLRFACEHAKRTLSSADSATIAVPDVLRTADGMVGLELKLDRATLARAIRALVDRSLEVCDQAISDAGLAPDQLSGVYLSGGTSHMPAVRDAVARHFAAPIRAGVAPDYAVCLGAATHAVALARRS